MARSVLVAVGGLVGAVARYWVAGAVQAISGSAFPAGTLVVNLLGSFVLGVVMTLSLERGVMGADLRTLLAVGVCGGFTTMSTFSWETLALLRDGDTGLALGNLLTSIGGCIAAVWAGAVVGRVL